MNKQVSLGFKSEYVVSHLESEITERDDYFLLRTPSNPNYYFGNLMALKVPLESKTQDQWMSLFQSEFEHTPDISHRTFTWSRSNSESSSLIDQFTNKNFEYEETHILAMKVSDFEVNNKLNKLIKIRALVTELDWQQWVDITVSNRNEGHSDAEQQCFYSKRADYYQQLSKNNFGQYLGAFDGETLVGFAGLYHFNGLARFQHVQVIPSFQNQSIGKTLLTELIQQTDSSVEKLVIVADEHYHATKLYQSLGFVVVEKEASLCWWPEREFM